MSNQYQYLRPFDELDHAAYGAEIEHADPMIGEAGATTIIVDGSTIRLRTPEGDEWRADSGGNVARARTYADKVLRDIEHQRACGERNALEFHGITKSRKGN